MAAVPVLPAANAANLRQLPSHVPESDANVVVVTAMAVLSCDRLSRQASRLIMAIILVDVI